MTLPLREAPAKEDTRYTVRVNNSTGYVDNTFDTLDEALEGLSTLALANIKLGYSGISYEIFPTPVE